MKLADTTCDNFINFARELFHDEGEFVPLHAPTFSGSEIEFLQDVINSTYVSTVGDYVDRFAREISEYVGAPFVTPVVSGTAGLHLALLGVGVFPGSLVLTQALSFVATANVIKYCQADPVFLDVETDSLGMDPVQLEMYLEEECEIRDDGGTWVKSSGRRVTACLPVHVFGNPCNIFEIKNICDKWGLPLVEDSAESLGSLENGKHTGTIGNVGVYSFNGNKIITTGAGGCVVSSDPDMARNIAHLANVSKVNVSQNFEFIHDGLGFNYKMPALNAALGLAQIQKIDKKIDAKKQIHWAYKNWFDKTDVEFLIPRPSSSPNFWLNAIKLEIPEAREFWLAATNHNGICTRPLWRPINQYPQFKDSECASLPVTETLSQLIINIPSSPGV